MDGIHAAGLSYIVIDSFVNHVTTHKKKSSQKLGMTCHDSLRCNNFILGCGLDIIVCFGTKKPTSTP